MLAGNVGKPSLFMNLDDGSPNPPESGYTYFNGSGTTTIQTPVTQLGDAYHGEGATCVPLNCVVPECPGVGATPTNTPVATATNTPGPTATNTPGQTATNTPVPTATNTPGPTPTNTPVPTATNTPVPTATNTPTPTSIHDAGVSRVGGPASVRLRPGVPDSSGRVTVVVANNSGDHADLVGVYLAFLPPTGNINEGGCSPAFVQNLGALSLLPHDRLTVSADPPWQCINPAAVDGANWTLKAIADVHGDDFGSCATLQQAFSGQCSAALADDDNGAANNTVIRARPKVVALSP